MKTSMLRQIAFLARKDVSYMLRAKETILWVFVMPIVFFGFIGQVTGGFGGDESEGEPDSLALRAPAESGFLVDELVRRLEAQRFTVLRAETDEAFAQSDRRLALPPLPEGFASFTEAVLAGEPAVLAYGSSDDGLDGAYDQIRVGRAVYGVLADLAAAAEEPGGATPEGFQRLRELPRSVALDVRPAGRRERVPSGYEQTIPGTLVMFTMMVLLTSGSILLVIERERGLLRRLASTPIPRSAVVLGKWAGKMALGLVQIGFAMLAGTVLFGMEWGSALPMVIALLFAWAAFNASLGILLGNLARSEAQMAGIGVISSMVLAALGGCWWPIEITPAWMQRLASFLPTGWAMNALHALVSFGRGAGAALPAIFLLLAGAVLLGGAAARTFRYQ